MSGDRRYLVTRGDVFWLQLASPRPLHGRFRRVVQRSLGTKSLKEAQDVRWAWVNGYKTAWEKALADPDMTAEEIEAEALAEHQRQERLEGRS